MLGVLQDILKDEDEEVNDSEDIEEVTSKTMEEDDSDFFEMVG